MQFKRKVDPCWKQRRLILIGSICAFLFFCALLHRHTVASYASIGQGASYQEATLSRRPGIQTGQQLGSKVKIDYYYNRSDAYSGPRVTYNVWPEDRDFPCVRERAKGDWRSSAVQGSPAHKGLLYMAEMKTGSSTMSGIVLSLAHRKSVETWDEPLESDTFKPCKLRVDHLCAVDRDYINRDKKRSFLLSMLREPTKRAISKFFHFQVSSHQVIPTDANFQSYLNHSPMDRNYYANDLSLVTLDWEKLDKLTGNQRDQAYDEIVQNILDEYDFIAVTERMDESLVVMSRLLRIPMEEVLYVVTDNLSGSFVADNPERNPCVFLVPSFLTPGMTQYFSSEWWMEVYVGLDYRLYHAAQVSLDDTIDALGRASIERGVKRFRKMLNIARTLCGEKVKHMCTQAGVYLGYENSTCLLMDMGCDHYCREDLRKRDWNQLIEEFG